MEVNVENMAQNCIEAISEKFNNLKRLNIIVTGKSGAGKSTLINSIFRGDLAETGIGRPVTQEIRKIVKKGYPLAIYDTPGFELSEGQQKDVKNEILDIIHKGISSRDINESIHCIWYCVNVGGNRTLDEAERKWLKELTSENKATQVPIIIVLTQAVPQDKAIEMQKSIEAENLNIAKVVRVLAKDEAFSGGHVERSYGLTNLIDVMAEVLPEELQDTFQNMQKVSLKSKKLASQAIIATAVAGSFGEGFAPIPFSDSALLVPTQVAMIAGITVTFGLDVNKSFLTSFVSATIGGTGATVLGKTAVSNILKLIPGVGTVAGGLISGTTAGIITTALGEAYIKIMEMVYKDEIKKDDLFSEKGKATMSKLFDNELKKTGKRDRKWQWKKPKRPKNVHA